jgi:transcriptional regulator with XRE-family HTH domain
MYGIIRCEEITVSALASYLRLKMDEKGWDAAQLARKAKVPTTTLHNILHQKNPNPRPGTLRKLAGALEVSAARLTSLTGYPIDDDPEAVERHLRLARLIDSLPWLESGVEKILQLSPEEQEDILDLVERRLVRRQKDQGKPRSKREGDGTEGNGP